MKEAVRKSPLVKVAEMVSSIIRNGSTAYLAPLASSMTNSRGHQDLTVQSVSARCVMDDSKASPLSPGLVYEGQHLKTMFPSLTSTAAAAANLLSSLSNVNGNPFLDYLMGYGMTPLLRLRFHH